MTTRHRADRLLVERGLFESRARAQAAIVAGRVTADGVVVRKAAEVVSADATIEAEPEHPFVSRGGVKLAAALDYFHIDVAGRSCLDVGASTGGFAQVLVRAGGRRVYAVDVGRGQLHASLRGWPEIVSLESTDIRALDPSRLAERPDLAVVDVSFVSLKLVVPAIGKLLSRRAQLLALIKPQFEARRRDVKKGIVRDAAVHTAVCADIAAFLAEQDWRVGGQMQSPILGGDGNAEFFIEAKRG
jgi:23S rRNA (cytidine1920-2'-O)/16S rRNA (cytidine1409-2'-O)-methyltransferase